MGVKMSDSPVALVTGGNRGIGFEVCRQLGRKGFSVILASRDRDKGTLAARELTTEGLKVHCAYLDVTIEESVDDIYRQVDEQFGRIDVLVNNAGVLFDPPRHPPDQVGASALTAKIDTIRRSFETNTLGAFGLCQKFAPMMRRQSHGRIVNVSSGMGQLSEMNGGWPGYRISKTALNSVTRIFADELAGSDILVNSVCPGWVRTEMGGTEAERSPAEGADTIVWLATLPAGGPTGGFFRDREAIRW